MSQALTLTEAAERLAPVFVEGSESFLPARPEKGKWMSLESAGAVLTERITGHRSEPATRRKEVTITQAAKQIETPYPDLADIRARRQAASIASLQRWQDLDGFVTQAQQYYQGFDEAALQADPQYLEVYAHAQQLRAAYDAAMTEANDSWNKQCLAENEVFEAGRPDWSQDNATKVVTLLTRLGIPEQDVWQLWLTPQSIDVNSPVCKALAVLSIGEDVPDATRAALGAVGFDDSEIGAVISGAMPVYMRDHRIQELVARAADAYTQAENRAAA